MSVGERVYRIRTESKLNQQAFADRINTSRAHISNIETGKKTASQALLRLICLEFCVNEDWLINGKGEKYNTALIDSIESSDNARGIIPLDKNGSQKSDAIQIAACLFHIFPNIVNSCVNIESFIGLFEVDMFCEAFNVLASSFLNAPRDKGKSFSAIRTVLISIGDMIEMRSERDIKKSLEAFSNSELGSYLLNYYSVIFSEGHDAKNKGT